MDSGEQLLLTKKEVKSEIFIHTDLKSGEKPIREV